MKSRVDAGTDIAMIGAWDAGRNDKVLASASVRNFTKALEEDAAEGHLFLIRTGSDGGGPIDIFVESEIPEDLRKLAEPIKGEHLLSLPTGKLVVGGVEDYRTGRRRVTSDQSVVVVPPGDYALRSFVGIDEDGIAPPSRKEFEKAVGAEDYAYFRRIQSSALVIYFAVPVLFLILLYCSGWKVALISAAAAGTVSYSAFKAWTARNDRFKRVAKGVNACWREAAQRAAPTFILQLRRASDKTGLKGGSVRLS